MNFDYSYSEVERLSNENYESDVDYTLRYTRRFFTVIGIWPFIVSSPLNIKRLLSQLMLPISFFFMAIQILLLLSHILLKELSRSELIQMMAPLSYEVTCFLKQVSLSLRTSLIKNSIEHMKTDWQRLDSEDERSIMMKNLKVGNDVTMICILCMYGSGIFYHAIMPLFAQESTNVLNETAEPRAYAGVDLFIDPHAGYNYEIIYCVICVSSFLLFATVGSACSLTAVLVTHACGQIDLIMLRLENLLSTDEQNSLGKDIVANRMAIIVRNHVRVLKFASQIDEVLREICLLEVMSSTITICLVEYYVMTEWNNSDSVAMATYAIFLTGVFIHVYIYCYVGELLKSQFHQVRIAAYNVKWYKLPSRTALAFVMIIIVGNYPPQLTAGRMIELSMYTFGTIIRTSLGYLNMLQKMAV